LTELSTIYLAQAERQARKLGRGIADPEGQGRAVDCDALAQQHLCLPVERQVPCVLAGQHVGDHRLGQQPALDQPLWRRCLHDGTFAGSASVFGPDRDDHPVLCRDDVKPLGLLLADDMHRRPAARAGRILGGDDHLDARQMRWQ